MTDHLTDLRNLKYSTENNLCRAQSKISELRDEIQKIEKEIRFHEGKKEIAEYMIAEIDGKIKAFEADNEVGEGIE